ncbi:MAG: pilus assembly protein PilZ [Spirochaetales bacterium]|nr:pilus assembly protein PilZ [Spirochaetales bacterium]
MVYLVAAIVAFSSAGAFLVLRRAGGGRFPWIQFYTKGKESGFNFKQLNLLRKVAVENHLENPTSLFWSIRQLDRSIKGVIVRLRSEGAEFTDGNAEFVGKLYEFRKKVEFALPKYNLGLKSTRKLANHQRIKITLAGIGTYDSQIVENLRRYMAISYPKGPPLPQDFSWRSRKISVYFWRLDDAGYVFETRIIDDFKERDYPILHASHTDGLVRSQKRRSKRVDVNISARIYSLRNKSAANNLLEHGPGLRSRLVDISEDGAAIRVGGRAKIGMVVKVQFSLTDEPLVMCGMVKGITYNRKKNQSLLHIQAIGVTETNRNKILSFVYNLFGEQSALASGASK